LAELRPAADLLQRRASEARQPSRETRVDPYERRGSGDDLGRQASSFFGGLLNYLRTRSAEHWLFFAVGVIVGLWIG
jgi:hypothetical protein